MFSLKRLSFSSQKFRMQSNNDKQHTLEVFQNTLPIFLFGKHRYVMVRRLLDKLIDECSGYFSCLCVAYWFVNAFVHQIVKYFIHKNFKICIYRLIWQSFNIRYNFGKLVIWQTSFKEKMRFNALNLRT